MQLDDEFPFARVAAGLSQEERNRIVAILDDETTVFPADASKETKKPIIFNPDKALLETAVSFGTSNIYDPLTMRFVISNTNGTRYAGFLVDYPMRKYGNRGINPKWFVVIMKRD